MASAPPSPTESTNPFGPSQAMDPTPFIQHVLPTLPCALSRAMLSVRDSLGVQTTINHPFPLQLHEFLDQPQAQLAYTAVNKLRDLLKAGFQTADSSQGPTRDLWLRTVSESLAIIHNSIVSTHSRTTPFSATFTSLSEDETAFFDPTACIAERFDSFFGNYTTNPEDTDVCARCLHVAPLHHNAAYYESVMNTCDQDVTAAYTTLSNDLIRTMTNDLQTWAKERTDEIHEAMIRALISTEFDATLLDVNNRVHEWMREARDQFHHSLTQRIVNDAQDSNAALSAWTDWAAQQVKNLSATRFAESRNAAVAEADAKAKAEAETYYNDKATELRAAADLELATFKHQLRIDTDLRKDNMTKAANAAIRTVSRTHPKLPPSHRVTRSQSRTGTPSQTPTRDVSIERPMSTTPNASPIVMGPPSQALTEPLTQAPRKLSEPLTDITVGPPSNSFESAMMAVDTNIPTVKDSIHNPGNSTPPSPSPHPHLLPSTSLRRPALGSGLDRASPPSLPPPSPPSLLDQLAALIDAKLAPVATSIRVITDRLNDMEDQRAYDQDVHGHKPRGRPYTPSAPTPAWASHSNDPPVAAADPYENATEEQIRHELIEAHRQRNHIWDIFVRIHNLPPSSFDNEHALLRSTHAEPFARFITAYDDFVTKVSEEPNHIPGYITTDDFLARLTTYWISHGDVAAPTDPLLPPDAPIVIPTKSANPEPATRFTTSAPRAPSPHGWNKIVKGKATSYAKIAAASSPPPPRPSPPPPTVPGTLSRDHASALTKTQILTIIKDTYKAQANTKANKGALVTFLLSLQACANPILIPSSPSSQPSQSTATPPPPTTAPAASRPRARPANQAAQFNTEFTVQAHAGSVSTRPPKQKAEDIVRSLRTAINQQHGGGPAQVTLLSGRWSSALNHNFVLTFAGKPTNDQVYKYRSVLTSPFGPGAALVPQLGYTHMMLHGVPLIRKLDGSPETSLTILRELQRNVVCNDLLFVVPPTWAIRNDSLSKTHASVSFAFIDVDGSLTQRMICHPPSLFGATTKAEKSKPLPLIKQCARCHALGHELKSCKESRNTTICPLCGSNHRAKDHHAKCPRAPHHNSIMCNCPPSCINCAKVGKSPKGHTALDHSCPLRKAFRTPTNRTGDSPDEEATTIRHAVSEFETAHPDPSLVLNVPTSSGGITGTLAAPAACGDGALHRDNSVPRQGRAESMGVAPSLGPARVNDDDVHMMLAPSNPFAAHLSLFTAATGVKGDHPTFHQQFAEWIFHNPPAAPAAGRHV